MRRWAACRSWRWRRAGRATWIPSCPAWHAPSAVASAQAHGEQRGREAAGAEWQRTARPAGVDGSRRRCRANGGVGGGPRRPAASQWHPTMHKLRLKTKLPRLAEVVKAARV